MSAIIGMTRYDRKPYTILASDTLLFASGAKKELGMQKLFAPRSRNYAFGFVGDALDGLYGWVRNGCPTDIPLGDGVELGATRAAKLFNQLAQFDTRYSAPIQGLEATLKSGDFPLVREINQACNVLPQNQATTAANQFLFAFPGNILYHVDESGTVEPTFTAAIGRESDNIYDFVRNVQFPKIDENASAALRVLNAAASRDPYIGGFSMMVIREEGNIDLCDALKTCGSNYDQANMVVRAALRSL